MFALTKLPAAFAAAGEVSEASSLSVGCSYMGIRRQAREAALQALFMSDALERWDLEAQRSCLQYFGIPKAAMPYAMKLCAGVIESLRLIDAKISRASENWSLNRMSRLDRNILRVATYELMSIDEVSCNVTINEAIEIAKRFGTDHSPTFINGVLDRIAAEVMLSNGNKRRKEDGPQLSLEETPSAKKLIVNEEN